MAFASCEVCRDRSWYDTGLTGGQKKALTAVYRGLLNQTREEQPTVLISSQVVACLGSKSAEGEGSAARPLLSAPVCLDVGLMESGKANAR
jgi:hypothetical protein